jgi:PAS domain S-box-containing protein
MVDERSGQLREYGHVLFQLARSRAMRDGDLTKALREITRTAANTLDIARVSVWLYDSELAAIDCIELFDRTSGSHTSGAKLTRHEFPAYFDALGENRILAASRAREDSSTREFLEAYLIPLNIYSMLDAPIHVEGVVRGVVCHEQVGTVRDWSSEEEAFAASIADAVGLALEADEVRRSHRELQQAHDDLARNEALMSKTQATAHIGSFEWDVSLNRMICSDEMLRICGIDKEAFFGGLEDLMAVVHPDDLDAVKAGTDRMLESRTEDSRVFRIVRPDDTRTVFAQAQITSKTGSPTVVTGFIQDITARTLAEEENSRLQVQLRHAQKMEAIGQLAAGVAHEFNNLLFGICGNAELLSSLAEDELPARCKRPIQDIQQAGFRAAELTKQLLSFARKSTPNKAVFDVNEMVTDRMGMLERLSGDQIAFKSEFASGELFVDADKSEIEQALVNLVVNSRDAIKECGTITVQTASVELTNREVGQEQEVEPGPFVRLSVVDDGSGMSTEVLERIFEPFFTTKEIGKGTGLGLSTVFADVKNCGGFVKAESAVDKGTAIHIYLPLVKGNVETTGDSESPPARPAGGNEVVLVCDDDEVVLSSYVAILEVLGYTVIPATGPAEAIQAATSHEGPLSLLLTDYSMPGMNGIELGNEIARLYPNIKVVLSSGYAADDAGQRPRHKSTPAFIPKPATIEEIAQTLRSVFDEAADS